MDDLENFLCRLLVVRHLHRHRAWARDCLNKEPRGNVGGNPQLPRFQDNVAVRARACKFLLCTVRIQTNQPAFFVPHPQYARD